MVSSDSARPDYYEIRIAGRLDEGWALWFDSLQVTTKTTAESTTLTLLSGPVADQAALFGLLGRVRDLGLVLLSVNRIQMGG